MVFSMAAGKATENNKVKEERRSNVDRRKFSYTEYIPERRTKEDRRKGENEKGKPEEQNSE